MALGLKTRWMEVLGIAGLIPFLGLAGLTAWASRYTGAEASGVYAHWNLLYGLSIVSFLGAVHWGLVLALAAQNTPNYLGGFSASKFESFGFLWGVSPSLLAWASACFLPTPLGLWAMAGVVALAWGVDRAVLGPMRLYADYLKLRKILSLGAIAGLAVTAWFA